MAKNIQSVEPNIADLVNGWLKSYNLDYKLEQETLNTEIDLALNDYYSKKSVGYDTADYLIRYLKLSGFKGELKEIEAVVKSLDKKSSGNYHPIGF